MIYIILGTKGQFMKMFPIMKLFDKYKVPYKFIHTSQHYEIIEENIKRFGIREPDVYLTLKKKDLKNIEELIMWAPKVLWNARKLPIKKSDWVLIHADTESTLLAVVIAKYFGAKTAHVESGVRSHNWLEPFPEELIRAFADYTCDVNFCPYKEDADNIKKSKGKIITNGNTVFDSVRYAIAGKPSQGTKEILKNRYILFLIHRKENIMVKDRINLIIDILELILKKGYKAIWPMHTNTQHELKAKGVWDRILKLKEKYKLEFNYFFDYVDFMHLVKSSEFVASDGGGLQKETYFLNKPMLILRKTTEAEPGVGENSFLSYLDKSKVRYFLNNYQNFRAKTKPVGSPSQVVVDYFLNMRKNREK